MKMICKNKKAFHDYFIEEKVECGLVLKGSEVKSLRMGRGNLQDGFALIRNGEAWLEGFHIPKIAQHPYFVHAEVRSKKLLMKKEQLRRLDRASGQKGYTLVPLHCHFNERGFVKVVIALAKGKAQHDKREVQKKKDADREIQRALRVK